MSSCFCGYQDTYENCCEPLLTGKAVAETPGQLMRSRYTAFAKVQIGYIEDTHHPKTKEKTDFEANESWAKKSQWLGLEIHNEQMENEDLGYVEFSAHYIQKGQREVHRERAEFRRHKNQWFFYDGKSPELTTVVRAEAKVGRNDPCPCGSGKKYKKCCA